MTPEKVTGLVLSSQNIGETDRRIVLLTKEKGKISAFARGAVRPKNPLVSSTQPFTFGEYFVYTGRDSYTVTGSEVKNHFSGIIKDLDKYYYASYLCEVADYYTRENLIAKSELLLLYQAIRAIERGLIEKELVRYIFEWRMLYLNGEFPEVFRCIRCGSEEELSGFSVEHHGVVCSRCMSEEVNISKSTIYTLQYIMTSRLEELFAFTVKSEILEELKMLTKKYIADKRHVKFNSEYFLGDMSL